jgi:hypothetical protein
MGGGLDGRAALRHAIMSVPVPGAPPRQTSAVTGLWFLDTALRLNHVRRLTERLTITDHRVARRITEVHVSLRKLDSEPPRAGTGTPERPRERPGQPDGAASGHRWVPVARLDRRSAAPVEVTGAGGERLPRLPHFEASRWLAAGLSRVLHGILDGLPSAVPDSDLHRFLHRAHESEWLVQHAIEVLVTERHRPAVPERRAPESGVLEGQGARYRSLALAVLDKHDEALDDFFQLFDIALDNELLIVGLDPASDEHLLSYETALLLEPEVGSGPRLGRLLRSTSDGYGVDYRSHISSSIPGYHLVVETEAGVDIDRMYLSTDADRRIAGVLSTDLTVLASRLENLRREEAEQGETPRASGKILELQMQTTLRELADLVRRRRWDAAQAGLSVPANRMTACASLALVAVAGEGTIGRGGEVDSSILRHPRLFPEQLRDAARELFDEELYRDVALENDPTTNRAHAHWRGTTRTTSNAAPIQIRSGMLLRDATTAGPRRVCLYALMVAVVGYLLAGFLTQNGWPFGAGAHTKLDKIEDADALISVLLLVPGFLYTKLGLSERHSIASHLRGLSRLVANICIALIALVGGMVAAGVPGTWVQHAFAAMVAIPLAGASLLLYRRPTGRETAELVRLGAPRWLDAADVRRVPGDARFYSAGDTSAEERS